MSEVKIVESEPVSEKTKTPESDNVSRNLDAAVKKKETKKKKARTLSSSKDNGSLNNNDKKCENSEVVDLSVPSKQQVDNRVFGAFILPRGISRSVEMSVLEYLWIVEDNFLLSLILEGG